MNGTSQFLQKCLTEDVKCVPCHANKRPSYRCLCLCVYLSQNILATLMYIRSGLHRCVSCSWTSHLRESADSSPLSCPLDRGQVTVIGPQCYEPTPLFQCSMHGIVCMCVGVHVSVHALVCMEFTLQCWHSHLLSCGHWPSVLVLLCQRPLTSVSTSFPRVLPRAFPYPKCCMVTPYSLYGSPLYSL